MEQLQSLLTGALEARGRVLLKLNVDAADLDGVIALLPALKSPTVSKLFGEDGFAVETVVAKSEINTLIPALHDLGANGHHRAADLQDRPLSRPRVAPCTRVGSSSSTTTRGRGEVEAGGGHAVPVPLHRHRRRHPHHRARHRGEVPPRARSARRTGSHRHHRPELIAGRLTAVQRRRLGASGLEVSALSLGAMTFGSGMPPVTTVDERDARVHGRPRPRRRRQPDRHRRRVRVRAVGGDPGTVRARIGGGRRDDVLVATKCGFGSHDAGALSYDNVVAACEASLGRLGLDHIDLYQLHRPDRATPIEETLRALDDLVTRGLVRAIGTSNFRGLGDVGRGGAPARARSPRVHRHPALLLARRARGRARAHPRVPGRRPRA